MKNYLVEAIGTLFLVLTVGLAVRYAGVLAGFAIGSVLMVMIYAGGHISGAHYNPAVSLGVWARGKISLNRMLGYWVAQLVGAAVGALLANYLIGGPATAAALSATTGQVMVAEFLFTFALVWVVLNSATDADTDGNSFYGLAIGFTVLVGAYAVGSISGGAFNPAVAVGGALEGLFSRSTIWMHIVAQLLAGFVAAQTYLAVKK